MRGLQIVLALEKLRTCTTPKHKEDAVFHNINTLTDVYNVLHKQVTLVIFSFSDSQDALNSLTLSLRDSIPTCLSE